MKQSEKDKILELIEKCTSANVIAGTERQGIINKTRLNQYLDEILVEQDPITEVYAVKDLITEEVHWNSHGCPYKNKDDAGKKINKLRSISGNQRHVYQILTFKLDDNEFNNKNTHYKEEIIKSCETCKYDGKNFPKTCDICTSLDHCEDNYFMWERKDKQ